MEVFIDKKNPKYEIIKYIESKFFNFFGRDIELKDFYYSFKNFGNFGLFYYYKPKDLMLIFRNERGIFEIVLQRNDGLKTSAVMMFTENSSIESFDFPSPWIKDFSSIDFYMNILRTILEEDRVKFYKFVGKGWDSKFVPVDD